MSFQYDNNDDDRMFDSNGCFHCVDTPRVKGRFGLAWVSETPNCPCSEPIGWQVEFHDTPSKVEQKCQEMVRWINCPPLPRCDPCPPEELCSPKNPPRCNPCAPMTNPCHPCCPPPPPSKRCSCCGGSRKRCFPQQPTGYCRKRSPRRRCDGKPKCTCDDVPEKDTNNGICSSSGDYKHQQIDTRNKYNSTSQVISVNASNDTVTLFRNDNNVYNTDTEECRSRATLFGFKDDDFNAKAGEERLLRAQRLDEIATRANAKDLKGENVKNRQAHKQNVRVSHLEERVYPHGCSDCCNRLQTTREVDCTCGLDDEEEEEDEGEDSKPDVKPAITEEDLEESPDNIIKTIEEEAKEKMPDVKPKDHVVTPENPKPKQSSKPISNTIEDTKPKNTPNYFKDDHRFKASMDSLDLALSNMAAKSLMSKPIVDEEQMQKEEVGLVETAKPETDTIPTDDKTPVDGETNTKALKRTKRPLWLPFLCNLCFRSKDTKSDHNQLKNAKSPKPKSPKKSPHLKDEQLDQSEQPEETLEVIVEDA